MRQFAFVEYDPETGSDMAVVKTMTEDSIREQYWPYWYERMCAKYGKQYVDENYTIVDCIEDWVAVNWAWEDTNTDTDTDVSEYDEWQSYDPDC